MDINIVVLLSTKGISADLRITNSKKSSCPPGKKSVPQKMSVTVVVFLLGVSRDFPFMDF